MSSSSIWTNPADRSGYLEQVPKETKILYFVPHHLPISNNLLNQEVLRVSAVLSNQEFSMFDGPQSGCPNLAGPLDRMPDVASLNLGHLDGNSGWKPWQQGFCGPQLITPTVNTNAVPATSSSLLTRNSLRLDVPVDSFPTGFSSRQGTPINQTSAVRASLSSLTARKFLRLDVPVGEFPNFNFVGRLLGPRGNSLKRIEDFTSCHIFIGGRGSMKDPSKEEFLRRIPGHEHLNEPLHVLIEPKGPVNEVDAQLKLAQEIILELLNPMAKFQDSYKRQQLRELSNLRSKESTLEVSASSGTSYGSAAMNRATTRNGTH